MEGHNLRRKGSLLSQSTYRVTNVHPNGVQCSPARSLLGTMTVEEQGTSYDKGSEWFQKDADGVGWGWGLLLPQLSLKMSLQF